MGRGGSSRYFQTALLFLGLSVLALAQLQHGDGGGEEGPDMEGMGPGDAHNEQPSGGHHMMGPTPEDIALWNVPSYWGLEKHVGLMYAHIAIMIIAWVVILPISKSGFALQPMRLVCAA